MPGSRRSVTSTMLPVVSPSDPCPYEIAGNIVMSIDDAFAVEKTCRKLEVVARRAHRHRDDRRSNSDFERLFPGQLVENANALSVVPFEHVRRLDTLRDVAHRRRGARDSTSPRACWPCLFAPRTPHRALDFQRLRGVIARRSHPRLDVPHHVASHVLKAQR